MTTILKKKAQVPASRKIIIKIPGDVPVHAPIEIIVSSESPSGSQDREKKMALMKQAQRDPQFLADLQDVMVDFKGTDQEHWPEE